MFKHRIGIVHNHDNDHLDWLFHCNIFPLRESTSIMSGNGRGFTLEELFRSSFTELWPSFLFNSIKLFLEFSGLSFVFSLLFNCSIVYFIYL